MSARYPWYDSCWLEAYSAARNIISDVRPEILPEFLATFESLKTRPDFAVERFDSVFDRAVMQKIADLAATLKPTELELHELKSFGRFVVHDHPFITELQKTVVDLVSEAANEPVEPSYNFLSLYTDLGVCPVHMDAPTAKWTLDLCIRQSMPWPIHISQPTPWPEKSALNTANDWRSAITEDPENRFEAYCLEPGQAILFSGSSQWHYRDHHPGDGKNHYCELLFLHFVPRGISDVINPADWARVFDVPELAEPGSAAAVLGITRSGS